VEVEGRQRADTVQELELPASLGIPAVGRPVRSLVFVQYTSNSAAGVRSHIDLQDRVLGKTRRKAEEVSSLYSSWSGGRSPSLVILVPTCGVHNTLFFIEVTTFTTINTRVVEVKRGTWGRKKEVRNADV